MEYIREYFKLAKNFPFLLFKVEDNQVLMHTHDCLEINYVLEGDGYYLVEDRKYPINAGDIYILNNKEPHIAVRNNAFKVVVILFDQELIWDNRENLQYLRAFFNRGEGFSNRIRACDQGYQELKQLLFQIIEEHEAHNAEYQLIIRSQLMLFLALLNRFYTTNHTLADDVSTFHRSYEKLRPILDLIHRDYNKQLTLEDLAAAVKMNKAYLCSFFKETLHMTIFDYVEQVRLNQACNLLKNTKQSVSEVAKESGFNSASYFNRVFKNALKMTPIQYRKAKLLEKKKAEMAGKSIK